MINFCNCNDANAQVRLSIEDYENILNSVNDISTELDIIKKKLNKKYTHILNSNLDDIEYLIDEIYSILNR